MVNCLGPISEVEGMTRIGASPRQVLTPNRPSRSSTSRWRLIHCGAAFRKRRRGHFDHGFDIWHKDLPYIEIDGTEGALRLSDPTDSTDLSF